MEEEVTTTEVAEEVSTEEVAEGTEETQEAPVEDGELHIPQPKRKQSAQERIDEITKARREAEREKEYWRKLALTKETTPTPPEVVQTKDGRPTVDHFGTTEEYEDALVAWHIEKRDRVTLQERQEREQQEALELYQERAARVRDIYEDFDEVVSRPVFSKVMRDVLLKSENGPEVSYYLALPENKSITARIKTLPPDAQIYELGKLEVKLEIAKKTKKTTGAPPPITPVETTTGGKAVLDESQLSDEEWFRLDQKRRLEKLQKKHGG